MNETTPPIPETPPAASSESQNPVTPQGPLTPSGTVDLLLKHPARLFDAVSRGERLQATGFLFVIATFCLLAYGGIVGLFSGDAQVWASPLKVAGGVLFSGLICLPSLYIFSCLSGMDRGAAEIAGLLLIMLCLASVLLIGFAPVAWVFSTSTESTGIMGVLHVSFWLVAIFFGVRLLFQGFAHYQVRNHGYLHLWVFVFMLVSLQMTATLRPILGSSDSFFPNEKKFFLQHWSDQLFSPDQTSAKR